MTSVHEVQPIIQLTAQKFTVTVQNTYVRKSISKRKIDSSIVAFRNFVNAPRKNQVSQFQIEVHGEWPATKLPAHWPHRTKHFQYTAVRPPSARTVTHARNSA